MLNLCVQGNLWYQLGLFPLLAVPPCPSPPTIRNGQHDSNGVTKFIPGMSVKYSCDPGYALTGKTTVSCLPSGVWSIPYPRCEGELEVLLPTAERESAVLTQPPKIRGGALSSGSRSSSLSSVAFPSQ